MTKLFRVSTELILYQLNTYFFVLTLQGIEAQDINLTGKRERLVPD
jgi:hypothetical protein